MTANRRATAIVDANNVVLHGLSRDEAGAEGKQHAVGSLSHLDRVCAALRRLGYDVLAIGDASFPYAVAERSRAQELVGAGQILLSEVGSKADDLILERARSLRALVISNDRFLDSRAHQRLSGKRVRRQPPAGSAFGALYRPGLVRVGYLVEKDAVIFRPARDENVVVRDDGAVKQEAGEAARSRLARLGAERSRATEPGRWESHEPSPANGAMADALKRAGINTDSHGSGSGS